MNRARTFDHYLGVSYFVHPVPLLAVGLLVLNDHLLKQRWPSWWTGKLSDFAGIFFFPLFLCALYNLMRNWPQKQQGLVHWLNRYQLLAAILITDLIFIGVKVFPPARSSYLAFMELLGVPSQVTMDPTDLLALAMNPATYFHGRRFFNV